MKRKATRSENLPRILPVVGDQPMAGIRITRSPDPLAELSLGSAGAAARVAGPNRFAPVIAVLPVSAEALSGIDPESVRVFRVSPKGEVLVPESGLNAALGYAWARLTRPGVYAVVGLPRDRLLQALLRDLATRLRSIEDDDRELRSHHVREVVEDFVGLPEADVEELRAVLARAEDSTGPRVRHEDRRAGRGGHLLAHALPGDRTITELREHLKEVISSDRSLPELQLFRGQDWLDDYPWRVHPGVGHPSMWIDPGVLENLDNRLGLWIRQWFPWFFSQDWWMYQADEMHSGQAQGVSNLRQSTVSRLGRSAQVSVDGDVISKPVIVAGKVYVGTSRDNGNPGGTLWKIDLATGTKEGSHTTSGNSYYPYHGIGGSPAVVGNRAYVCNMGGRVYCIDTDTMTTAPNPPNPVWVTDLRLPDQAKNQPLAQPNADCWSGPLVVNGKVYVGCGEGEDSGTYGFVVCLDAGTGRVVWLFCTSKFQNRRSAGADNAPNVVPQSVASGDPWVTAAGFTVNPDPTPGRSTGCSVWSSCAYDSVLGRIYVGTGNSQYNWHNGLSDTEAPDKLYGSGLLSLDADTGAFRGFFSPQAEDSYWPGDADIDVPGSPSIISYAGRRAVAFGSKSGSCFLLDPDTLAPIERRQMLPRAGGSGVPGDRGTGVDGVVPTGGHAENPYGIFGTPAVDQAGALYVGLGGYHGLALDVGVGINPTSTPFLRGVKDADLSDLWPTVTGTDGIARYQHTNPPMYLTREVGLSSPAVANDVVFVSTGAVPGENPPLLAGLYALAADTGLCLWKAPAMPPDVWCLGPAVYGDYVVVGAGTDVHIFTLRHWWPIDLERMVELMSVRPPWWPPPPPPPPWDGERRGGRGQAAGGR